MTFSFRHTIFLLSHYSSFYHTMYADNTKQLFLSFPDISHLPANRQNIEERNYQEQYRSQSYGRQHTAILHIRIQGLDEIHIIVADKEKSHPGNHQHSHIQPHCQYLIRS